MSDQQVVLAQGKEGKGLLPHLYALRAGISAVSVERDKIDERERRIRDLKSKNSSLSSNAINTKNNAIQNARSNIATLRSEIDDCQRDIEYKRARIKESEKKSVAAYLFKLILVLIPTIVYLGAVIYASVFSFNGLVKAFNFEENWPPVGFLDWIAFIIICVIFLVVGGFFCGIGSVPFYSIPSGGLFWIPLPDKDGVFTKKRDIRNAQIRISLLQAKTRNATQKIAEEERFIEETEAQFTLPAKIGENEKSITVIGDERGKLIATASAFVGELERQFAPVIDKRDWQNLDLIIYYFETGRADSRKEALQLVDKEIQTKTIVQALGYATKEICENIRDGLNQVRSDMIQCFGLMGRLISETAVNMAKFQHSLHQEQMGAIRAAEAYNEATYARMTELVSSVNLQNALQAKANESSERLASDVAYMKTLSESAERRRVNNAT